MAELYPTTRREFVKGALAASSLLTAAPVASDITRLIAERRRLTDVINNAIPGDMSPEETRKWLADVSRVADRLADAPVTSKSDALELMRFVDSRLADDLATDLDRALIRNVMAFMGA